MSLVPKAVYPFASEKGEPIFSDVLGIRSAVSFTLAPGASRILEFLPENSTVIIPNVVEVWSTGIAKVVTDTPVAFGKEIIRDINFDTKPLLDEDIYTNPSTPDAQQWIITNTAPISGTASYANPYDPLYNSGGAFIIPEAYQEDFPNQEWRFSFDWSFTPGSMSQSTYAQLRPMLGGGPPADEIHSSPWDSGPKVAAKGSYDGPMNDVLYGITYDIRYLGDTAPIGYPYGETYRIDNVVLYVVGGGANPMRTNTYYVIPNEKQLLSVQDEIIISNPAAEGGESITVIVNQVVRWSQVSNPGTYVGNA